MIQRLLLNMESNIQQRWFEITYMRRSFIQKKAGKQGFQFFGDGQILQGKGFQAGCFSFLFDSPQHGDKEVGVTKMTIYPAIDLLDRKCVRLTQGKYDEVTVYSENPLEIASDFAAAGAQWIHMVDLNAAKTGIPENTKIIEEVVKKTNLCIQTGGGIRDFDRLQHLLDEVGVSRCVIGTSAIKDRAFTEKALSRYGDRIAIGLDAKNGEIAVDGWTQSSGIQVGEFAGTMMNLGAKVFIYTDIARDGMLTGPATESTRKLVDETGANIIASGGIGSFADVKTIRTSGCSGVIIGKAIYERKVRLEECLQNG